MNQAGKRILISDCDVEVLIALEHVLEDDGFDTTTASTIDETLRLLGQQKFDLLLVADHPPELNCERLLRNSQSRGTPVVALENRPRHPFAEPYLLSLGVRRIVNKWEHREVQDAVNELLVRHTGESAKSAVAGTAKLG
jgi:DNA-binding response OmpR family regulator